MSKTQQVFSLSVDQANQKEVLLPWGIAFNVTVIYTHTHSLYLCTQRNKSYFLCLDVIESTVSMLQYFSYYIKTMCPSFTVEPCVELRVSVFGSCSHRSSLWPQSCSGQQKTKSHERGKTGTWHITCRHMAWAVFYSEPKVQIFFF